MRRRIQPALVLLFAAALPLAGDQIEIVPKTGVIEGIRGTGQVRAVVNYQVGAQGWTTTTKPLVFDSASLLASEGLENPFMQALTSNMAPGWSYTFNTTAAIADNTFQVNTYEAQAPPPPASNNDAFTLNGLCGTNNCVGAQFFFTYVPTGDDPNPNPGDPNQIHWVQLLYDNYAGQRPVAPFYEIDIKRPTYSPYYDYTATADATRFLDTPYCCTNTGAGDPIFFDALALLVTGPTYSTPGQFTIYGGVEWGWSNQPTPEPTSLLLFATGLAGLALIIRRRSCTERAVGDSQ